MNSVNNIELKNLSHSKGQSWDHIVLVPRARYPVFKYERTKQLCEEGLKETRKRNKIDLFTYEVMPDHVHIFISCPPRKSVLKMCAVIKGGTSYYIRKNQPSLQEIKMLKDLLRIRKLQRKEE